MAIAPSFLNELMLAFCLLLAGPEGATEYKMSRVTTSEVRTATVKQDTKGVLHVVDNIVPQQRKYRIVPTGKPGRYAIQHYDKGRKKWRQKERIQLARFFPNLKLKDWKTRKRLLLNYGTNKKRSVLIIRRKNIVFAIPQQTPNTKYILYK